MLKTAFLAFIAAILAFSANAATEISLITCSPGSEIYELCGHTALRVRNPGLDMDMAVNYGTFDFNAPNFVYRFVKGETDYMVSAYPFSYFIEEYRRQGRGVYEQKLDLSPAQADSLVQMLAANLLPENRTYRYNYVKDNCSTRPLMMVERALGTTLEIPDVNFDDDDAPLSFRDIMRHFHANYPWYQLGIDLALGSGIDYPVSQREKTFAPLLLEEALNRTCLPSGKPLVTDSVTLLAPAPGAGPLSPTPWYLSPVAVAWALFIFVLAVVCRDVRRRRVTRWVDAVLFSVYGIAGLLLAFLVFVSVHEATSPNWLILWLNPLCLIVPACIYIKKCRPLLKFYGFINFAAIILLIVSWPWLRQAGNPAFVPLIAADIALTMRYLYITLCAEKTTLH